MGATLFLIMENKANSFSRNLVALFHANLPIGPSRLLALAAVDVLHYTDFLQIVNKKPNLFGGWASSLLIYYYSPNFKHNPPNCFVRKTEQRGGLSL